MRNSRVNPETYRLALYYAMNPWSGKPNGQHSVPLNVKIIGVPKGRNAERLQVDLIQVFPVNTPVAKPKDKVSKAYFIEAITQILAEHTGRIIDAIPWTVVDFTEEE
jgi:hypothetical protein